LVASGTDLLALALRPSEINSTRQDTVLIGVEIQASAGSSFQPGAPQIAGLTPLGQHATSTSSFALFAISREGLRLLKITGATTASSGAYSVHVFVAGDANQDGNVDGLDGSILSQTLGSSAGQSKYVAAADADRDGTIDASDAQILASNFGFTAIGPPVIHATDLMTHIDLPTSLNLTAQTDNLTCNTL